MNKEAMAKGALAPREVDYPPEGVGLGNGWDSQLGRKTSVEAVVFKEIDEPSPSQAKDFYTCQILNRSNLLQELDISAEGSYEGWGAKVSAKAEFSSEVKVNELSQSFVAHAVVRNVARRADTLEGAIDLKPKYAKMAQEDPAEFRRRCGDCYVSSIEGGAELVAVLTFHVTDRAEKKKIAASMEGSGWGANLSGEVGSNIETYSKNEQLTIRYCQSGGSGDALPTDLHEIVEKIKELPSLAAASPYPYKIGLKRYDTLPSWPRDVTLPDLQPYRDLLVQYNRYKDLHDLIDGIRNNAGAFLLGRGVTEDSLKEVQDELLDGLRAMENVLGEKIEYRQDPVALPEEASKSDYAFRARLPIPCAYDEQVSISMKGDELRRFIFERWIEQPNQIRKDRLKHEELEEYEQMIYEQMMELRQGPLQTGDVITLQAVNGKYLCQVSWEYNPVIWAFCGEIDRVSSFTVTVLDDGKIALQAHTGKYLSQISWHWNDEIWAVKDEIDKWSRFTVEFRDPVPTNRPYEGKIALQALNNKYVSLISYKVKDEWQSRIWASKEEIDEYSEFTVKVLNV